MNKTIERRMRLSVLGSLLLFFMSYSNAAPREVIDLDSGWRFLLGDDPSAAYPDHEDSDWRALDIPHDWAFEAPFSEDGAQGPEGGYKPGGVGWYRYEFTLPESWSGKRVRLEFDGVYMNSTVWLNGHKIGGRGYGYISFGCELTPWLEEGRNVIAVRVDNTLEPSSRWYHGCGIYAPVRMVVTDTLRVAPYGVQVVAGEIGDDTAGVSVTTTLDGALRDGLELRQVVYDMDKTVVAETKSIVNEAVLTQTLDVKNPQRWDIDNPVLYTVVTEIWSNESCIDKTSTRFGLREIRWEQETGFWLNGRVVKLRGVADHLEGGPVGAASTDSILRWKLELLKGMGVNAIRVAHNPQVPRFYELCDEMGILVMDEIFDGWERKALHDYGSQHFATDWEQDVADWMLRDRNHPSIIIWSVGNETHGDEIARRMVALCNELDPTRPVTSGHSASQEMNVFGVNGFSESKRFFSDERPDLAFVATEAPHTWQVRGYYRTQTWYRDGYPNDHQDPFEIPDLTPVEIFEYEWASPEVRTSSKQIFNSSYDNATVRITARRSIAFLRDLPWYSGAFRWTGFDYLGEASFVHGGWPFRAFMGGALDLAGFPKDLYFLYQSQWTDSPMVHLLPHWTHPRMEAGTIIPVWAYSNGDEVELFLNGRSLGKRKPGDSVEDMHCSWDVPWEPGAIEAVAYRDSVEIARDQHTTATEPARLGLESVWADSQTGTDGTAILTVSIEDAEENFYPYGENEVVYDVEGPAKIISLENGDPVDTTPNWGVDRKRAFFGLSRVFLQPVEADGDILVTAAAILGERRQLSSPQVRIDVRQISLRGDSNAVDLKSKAEIFYTLDGSAPSKGSEVYSGPFSIPLGTTVRAVVYREGVSEPLELEERFASDVGIYWPSED